jgi:hypothetical protein
MYILVGCRDTNQISYEWETYGIGLQQQRCTCTACCNTETAFVHSIQSKQLWQNMTTTN